jgi:hypothetical protein
MAHYQKYSREQLVNLPIKIRKDFVRQNVDQYINNVVNDAACGKTSSLITIRNIEHYGRQTCPFIHNTQQAMPSNEELIEALQERFPDCKIYYDEKWVSSGPDKQELKKGITVEWA